MNRARRCQARKKHHPRDKRLSASPTGSPYLFKLDNTNKTGLQQAPLPRPGQSDTPHFGVKQREGVRDVLTIQHVDPTAQC